MHSNLFSLHGYLLEKTFELQAWISREENMGKQSWVKYEVQISFGTPQSCRKKPFTSVCQSQHLRSSTELPLLWTKSTQQQYNSSCCVLTFKQSVFKDNQSGMKIAGNLRFLYSIKYHPFSSKSYSKTWFDVIIFKVSIKLINSFQ